MMKSYEFKAKREKVDIERILREAKGADYVVTIINEEVYGYIRKDILEDSNWPNIGGYYINSCLYNYGICDIAKRDINAFIEGAKVAVKIAKENKNRDAVKVRVILSS